MDGSRAGVSEECVVVDAAGRGDGRALGAVLGAQRDWLMRYVGRRLPVELRSAIGAEDVVQETFLHAVRHAREFRSRGPGSLRRWLAAVANNRLRDLARAHRRLKRGGLAERADDGDAASAAASLPPDRRPRENEERAALDVALVGLRREYAEAIRLRYLGGLSVSQVASRLGRTTGAVSMLCHRGIKKLRRTLRPMDHCSPFG